MEHRLQLRSLKNSAMVKHLNLSQLWHITKGQKDKRKCLTHLIALKKIKKLEVKRLQRFIAANKQTPYPNTVNEISLVK